MNYQNLLSVLNNYFSDTSRTARETLEDFNSLRDELDVLIGALEADVEGDE